MQDPSVVQESGVTIVCPGSDYETIFASELEKFDQVLELAKTIDPPLMLLDLTHIQHFGSTFVELLMRLSNQICVTRNGRIGICHLTKYCQAVFTLTQLDRVFELYESRAEAVKALTKPADPISSASV